MTTCTPSVPVLHEDHPSHDRTETDSTSPDTCAAPPVTGPEPRRRIAIAPVPVPRHAHELVFPAVLATALFLFLGGGMYARRFPSVSRVLAHTATTIRTEFHFSEPRRSVPPPPAPVTKVPVKNTPPVDLTERKQPDQSPVPAEEPEAQPQPVRKPVRKVFGLRKVYSTGLGTGGTLSDAVVGKIGNTVGKEYDTITATESDVQGTVVSTATVTSAPRFRKVVKPEYTSAMIGHEVEGTVKVKVLVDIDGKVKKATCLNDIGFDSAAQAVKATLSMEFVPAMRGDTPVAVWIIVPIRFVMLG